MELVLIVSVLFIIVLFVIIFNKIGELRDEVDNLKKSLKPGKSPAMKSEKIETRSSSQSTQKVIRSTEPPSFKNNPDSYFNAFGQWLKTDWLMKLGALFVLLAIVWFVRYAIVNNWIGEFGRVAMGIGVGAAILVGGFSQLKKRPVPGQVLMSLGTTAILFTIYIARNYYDIFTPLSAMAIMGFLVLMVATVAVVDNSLSLAVTSILGGMIAPLLVNSDAHNYLFLNSYVLLLDIGIFIIVSLRGWRVLLPIGIIATGLYSLNTFNEGNLTKELTWLFMGLYYTLFFVGTFTSVLYSKIITIKDAITTILTVVLLIAWVSEYVPDEWKSSVLAVAVIFASVVAVISLKLDAPKKIVYLSGVAAIALLGAATSFELEDQSLAIALSLEAAVVIAMIRYILFDVKATLVTSSLFLVPIVLALKSFDSWSWNGTNLLNKHFFALLVVGLSIGVIGIIIHGLLKRSDVQESHDTIKTISIIELATSGAFFIALVWRSLESQIESASAAHGIALVAYTIVALILFFIGLGKQSKSLRWSGLALLIAVILRLSFVEVWQMSLTVRTITFVVIGILLITTAFFQKKQNIINK